MNIYDKTLMLDLSNQNKISNPKFLFPKTESVDENFEFEVSKVYTIKLKKNGQTIMKEQVTAMDLYILNKKMCF